MDTVNTGELRWPTEAEQWGNVMIRVEDAMVVGNDFQYEVFAADDGSGSVFVVDDDSDISRPISDMVGPSSWFPFTIYGRMVISSLWKL